MQPQRPADCTLPPRPAVSLDEAHQAWVAALGPLLGAMVQRLALDELVKHDGFELLAQNVGPSSDAGDGCRLWVHQVRLRDSLSGLTLLVGGHLLSWADRSGHDDTAYRNLITYEVNRLDPPEPGSALEVCEHVRGTATSGDAGTTPSEAVLRTLSRSLERDCEQLGAFVRAWATP